MKSNIRIILQVPTFAYEKRLSRIETLRLAITYITFMDELLSCSVSGDCRNGGDQSSRDHPPPPPPPSLAGRHHQVQEAPQFRAHPYIHNIPAALCHQQMDK